jgi:Methyltransferase domain
MDLLPKNHKQFQEEGYWARFFQDKQTKQGFEWYASYEELEYYLKHAIKDKEQKILVVGCGNSMLSEKMHKALNLTNKVTSIDFEENVIKKMNHRGYAGVDYQVMDALNMTFEPESFNYAIDKGTLDALCADRTPETASRVVAYFNQVVKTLNAKGGTYICVSLLQDFVLDALITFFSKGIGNDHAEENIFEFRIQKIEKIAQKTGPDGREMLPFFITIKRTKIPKDPKLEELRVKMSETVYFQDSAVGKAEMQPISGIHDRVKKEQIAQMFIPRMKELNLSQKYELFCFDKNQTSDIPRYTLTVIDSNDAKILKKRTCAAFITP